MPENDPTRRGDISKQEFNATEEFLSMNPSDFRIFLEDCWRENKNLRIVVDVLEETLTEPQRNFLRQIKLDSRVETPNK